MASHAGAQKTEVDVEQIAVTAHVLLNRLSMIQSTLARVERSGAVSDAGTELMLARSRAAISDIQAALEDMSRGVPPLVSAMHRAG